MRSLFPNPFAVDSVQLTVDSQNQCTANNDQCTEISEQLILGINSEPEQFHPRICAPSPFKLHTSIIYRTGDYGRCSLPDGNIEFLGRIRITRSK